MELWRHRGRFKAAKLAIGESSVSSGLAHHQIRGGNVTGIGLAMFERHVYDPRLGLPAKVLLCQSKPPTYLDVPKELLWAAVDKPDPQNPVGVSRRRPARRGLRPPLKTRSEAVRRMS